MSNETTRQMMEAYIEGNSVTRFFSSQFQSPRRNFHNSESIEFDIVRGQEEISVVIQDLSTGYRDNSTDIYTNKSFIPPIHKEKVTLNAFNLLKRMPGNDPFQDPGFRAALIEQATIGFARIQDKIRRAIEEQASQVMQTGTAILIDSNGVALYSIDYKPKATHFPTTSNAWSGGSATIAADIASLGAVVRSDGLADPDQLIMGNKAFDAFITDTDIQLRYDNRRINQGDIVPMQVKDTGAQFRGTVELEHYKYDIFTYGGKFTKPDTGASTFYMDPAKCIVRASSGRMDATFGAIPNFNNMLDGGTQLVPELPSRLTNVEGGLDLFTNIWKSVDGEQLFAGVGARPLMIPTAIDTFGCIDTLST